MTRVLTLSISVTIAGQAKKTIRLPRGFLPAKKYEQVEVYMLWGLEPLRLERVDIFAGNL